MAATFSYSLKKWKLTQPGDIRVIGFKNYVDILTSDSFWYSLQNTLVILAVVVVLTTVVGFLVSSFLNIQVLPLRGIAGAGGASVGAAPFC